MNILPYLEENDDVSLTDEEGRSIDLRSMKGSEIVARATDEGGEKYIDFSYSVLTAESSDAIVKSAQGLVSEEDYQYLLERVRDEEEHAARMYEELSRSLTMAQQKELYRDLKKLVIKAVVLLTAGLVYAAIPKTMIWGRCLPNAWLPLPPGWSPRECARFSSTGSSESREMIFRPSRAGLRASTRIPTQPGR